MNTRFFKALHILLITLMPVVVVGCGDAAVQNMNSSPQQTATASNSTKPTTLPEGIASPQESMSQPTTTAKPDAAGVFQNIDRPSASASSGSTLTAVVSSGQQGMQQVLQKTPLQPTESQILAPYVSQLESLQSTYIESLYSLYSSAKAEYHAGHQTKLQIESKYLPQAMSLEDNAQNQVNSVLFALRDALAAKGFSTNEVNVLRNAYYSEVAQMQAQFGR